MRLNVVIKTDGEMFMTFDTTRQGFSQIVEHMFDKESLPVAAETETPTLTMEVSVFPKDPDPEYSEQDLRDELNANW